MTVYVTQETNANFSKAEAWGRIEFLTHEDLNNLPNSPRNEALINSLRYKLRNYNADEDWIVIAGSPYVSAAVFMLLAIQGHSGVRILRWDNRDLCYIPMYLTTAQRPFHTTLK